MELKWLEDFLTLADCGSFSKGAERRNVTQPAFSRRIQKLEQWLDVPLVDRSSYPVKLLPNAVQFVPEVQQLVARILELRSDIQREEEARHRIAIATQHTLTITVFPGLLNVLREARLDFSIRLRSVNRAVGADLMRDGAAQMLLCYDTPADRVDQVLPGLDRLVLGLDRLIPVSAPNLYDSETLAEGCHLAMLRLPRESHLGSIVERECLSDLLEKYTVSVACESAFTVGVKELAMAGMGFAWLPESLVEQEIRGGDLVSLEDHLVSADLSIALYRYGGTWTDEVEPIWALMREFGAARTPVPPRGGDWRLKGRHVPAECGTVP